MIPRSWLYVPGDRPDRFDKAIAKGADAIVLDLEDAVSIDRKSHARDAVCEWLSSATERRAQVWVRVNQGDVGLEDAKAVVGPTVTGLCLPKVDQASTVDQVLDIVSSCEVDRNLKPGATAIVPLIESARGLEDLRGITRAPRVRQLQVGEVDLAADLGLSGSVDEHLASVRSSIVIASIAAGILPPVGPVSTEFRDMGAFRLSTCIVQEQGFVGRACIHPDQVAVANEIFTPTQLEVDKARSLLDRLDEAVRDGSGVAIDADGRMIDEASARTARRVLDFAESLEK